MTVESIHLAGQPGKSQDVASAARLRLSSIMIERCTSFDQPGWLSLREELWPHCSRAQRKTWWLQELHQMRQGGAAHA